VNGNGHHISSFGQPLNKQTVVDAANQAGGDSAFINTALATVAATNQAYGDSDIFVTLRLVTQPIKVGCPSQW
jgi:hypothetical protein